MKPFLQTQSLLFLSARNILVVLFCLVAHCTVVRAQDPYYYTLNDENLLPSNEVYCVVQDRFGFIWIGSEAGLFRYDGFQLKSYTNTEQNGKAISSLQFDNKGILWCQNFAGQIYRVQNDQLEIACDLKNLTKNHPPFDLDSAGNLYIGMQNGLIQSSLPGVAEKSGVESQAILELGWMNSQLILFKSDNQFYRLEGSKEILLPVKDWYANGCWLDKNSEQGYIVASRNFDNSVRIYSFRDSLIEQRQFLTSFREPPGIYTCYQLEKGKIWLTTTNGAYELDSLSGTIIRHLFPGEKISNLLLDREGNYWFTSLENGVHIVPELNTLHFHKSNSSLTDQYVTALCQLNANQILVGTFSGQIFLFDQSEAKFSALPMEAESIYRAVAKIIPFQNKLVASRGNLSFIDSNLKTESSQVFNYLRDIEVLEDTIYFASSQGAGQLWTENYSGKILSASFSTTACRQVEYDSINETWWFGQSSGLAWLNGDSLELFLQKGNPIYATSLHFGLGILWVGTVDQGLLGFENKQIRYHFNSMNGLHGNSISAITSDKDRIYVATENGVSILSIASKESDLLNLDDGINTKDINVILPLGPYLYLGTSKGLYQIYLPDVQRNSVKPVLQDIRLWVNEILVNAQQIDAGYQDKIKIEFSSASIRSRSGFGYKYRMNESQKWQKISGTTPFIELSNLQPGTYRIEILAENSDHYLSENSAIIDLKILPPFWQRWWFYVALILATILIVGLIYNYRIRSIRHQALMRERLVRSQLGTLKAQMNPHFLFNSLNSIQDLILQQDVKNSYSYLNKFSLLMRKVLEASEADEISLKDEISFLKLYLDLEKLRFGDDFNFSIQQPDDALCSYINLPSMLIQPFVENAIKHGLLHRKGLKKLELIFTYEEDLKKLHCIIRDNGIGRKKSEEIKERHQSSHKSFATKATQQRLELMNSRTDYHCQIRIVDLHTDGQASGTEVQIDIQPGNHHS